MENSQRNFVKFIHLIFFFFSDSSLLVQLQVHSSSSRCNTYISSICMYVLTYLYQTKSRATHYQYYYNAWAQRWPRKCCRRQNARRPRMRTRRRPTHQQQPRGGALLVRKLKKVRAKKKIVKTKFENQFHGISL